MDTKSYWSKSVTFPRLAKSGGNCAVDVVVIGAGITGITAAYMLKRAGKTVALVERGPCGGFDTSNTTAHLTCVTDTRLHDLVAQIGEDAAKGVWDGGRAAIDQIWNNIQAEKIDCEFAWIPGYLYSAASSDDEKEKQALKADQELAQKLGFASQTVDFVPLFRRFGVKFPHQAKFHPLKYLSALLRTIPGDGSYVFDHTSCEEIHDDPLAVKTDRNQIRGQYIILATHNPLMGKTMLASATLFQTKLFLYTSYAIGAKIPSNLLPEASYWDTGNPYTYLRIDKKRGFDYAILGGEDHKTGQVNKTSSAYERLEKKLEALIPETKVDSRWSGQVIETVDGLPYIGETAERQFVATGFSGNGMTFGTLGAMMAVDAALRRKNPWQTLFGVHRKLISGTWHYLKENADYPYYLLRDWLGGGVRKTVRGLPRNQGRIIQWEGKKVAAYRDSDGKVTLCSAVCTHLKCIVGWNDAEKTWDCPCHGSRFAATGEVLTGPAEEPLEKVEPKNGSSKPGRSD